MARYEIRGGSELDIPSQDEIRQIVSAELRAGLVGIKYMRLPVLTGTPANSALLMGGHANQDVIGPSMGDAWVIRHLWMKGLTASATAPDAMNVLVNNQQWWQLNGNNFAYTFGPGELVLLQGEALAYQNSGTLAATGQISTGGAYWRVPGEMLARLVTG